jgi:seryl-tRNA synthetase
VSNEVGASTTDQLDFLQELVAAGLLIESGVSGVYGHGAAFEQVRDRLTAVVSELAGVNGASRLSFPPIIPRRDLETNGYVGNFPHLAGSIFGFDGSEADAMTQSERAAAHEDWSEFQAQTDLMMLPAACYPVYPAIAQRGPLSPGGEVIDIGGSWVFRHEPSLDPARRQVFRMHEIVRVGEPEAVAEWRSEWAERGVVLFREIGLHGELENANDPFFGRIGRLLAANQSAEDLKWELLVQIAGPEPTACASFNCHLDHFGEVWDLRLADGSIAHTACAAFGQDRIVLALLRTHGTDPAGWPTDVRTRLGLD